MHIVVMSGISGSGKSTLAGVIAANSEDARIVSADNYFLVDGKYVFNAQKLGEAHAACFREFLAHLSARTPLVIVDNTNTRVEEISPYMLAAAAHNYSAEIITLECDLKLSERNTHNVPLRSRENQAQALSRRRLPPYWKNTVHKAV